MKKIKLLIPKVVNGSVEPLDAVIEVEDQEAGEMVAANEAVYLTDSPIPKPIIRDLPFELDIEASQPKRKGK